MRKKGKPNPDQRFFFLVVSLCAHVVGEVDAYLPVVAHASEKIIVRASNPGQFENDMELSWQKGTTQDSIFHAGRVGINTDRPEESLVVHGNIKITGHIVQPSDRRAKMDVQELDTKEQLKNVANLRIVRYRYLPEFAAHVGVSQTTDTGVIAQEVQDIIPEAVMESGDVLLNDGHLMNKLLVVNKERIFMENVGAVKELCKVTDNLENRIDELEKINRKLTSIKRKDSLKSTSTDISRVSSIASRGKRRSHRTGVKCRFSKSSNPCSNRFVQTTVIALVLIMAFCLIALATLYIMEWQNRHWVLPYFAKDTIITIRSSPSVNSSSVVIDMSTASLPKTSKNSFSEFGSTSVVPSETILNRLGSSTGYYSTNVMTSRHSSNSSPLVSASSLNPMDKTIKVLGDQSVECPNLSHCPVFCCSHSQDLSPDRNVENPEPVFTHVDIKRNGATHDHKFTGKKIDPTTFPLPDSLNEKSKNTNNSNIEGAQNTPTFGHSPTTDDTSSKNLTKHSKHAGSAERRSHNTFVQEVRKLRKRMLITSDNPKPDAEKENTVFPVLHLLELNTTLNGDFCSDDQVVNAVKLTCKVFLSRHFPLTDVTLRVSAEITMIADFCDGTDFMTCPSEREMVDKDNKHVHQRQDLIPQGHSWLLPVGTYFTSTYRFRLIPRNLLLEGQQLCNIQNPSVIEYILIFQRKCDK